MKTAAIMGGIAVAILVMCGLRKDQRTVTDEKLHELQDKFKSLDADAA